MARSIESFDMFSTRAARTAARRRGFMAGSGKPSLAATVISRASLLNSLDFTASCRPLRCMMFLNCECPAISLFLGRLIGVSPWRHACVYCGLPRSSGPPPYAHHPRGGSGRGTRRPGSGPTMTMWTVETYRPPDRRFQTGGRVALADSLKLAARTVRKPHEHDGDHSGDLPLSGEGTFTRA